jgi:hypothetical protein
MYDINYLKKIAKIWFNYQDIQQGKTRFLQNLTNKYFFIDFIRNHLNQLFYNQTECYCYMQTRKMELVSLKNVHKNKLQILKIEYFIVDQLLRNFL